MTHALRLIASASLTSFLIGATGWSPSLAAQAGGALPRTKADAEKWLKERGQGSGQDALAFYLGLGSKWSADVVRMMLLSGASATKPDLTGDYPLSGVAISCDGEAAAAEIAEILIQAGASVNVVESKGRKATPAMAAVMCPAVLKVILSKKPDLNVVDANKMTAMDYAIRFGKPREEVMRLMVDGGFDLRRHRAALLEEYSDTVDKIIESLSPSAPSPAPRATGGTAAAPARPATAATAPRTTIARPAEPVAPVVVDWKAVGPYPARTAAEATRLLRKPGADTTTDDHFWDAINQIEPQRLALAIQAGAVVRQVNKANAYTPLMSLVDSCAVDRNVEAQVSIVDQLIAAGADATYVHPDGWTALIIAADDCPIGIINALVKAGNPLNTVQRSPGVALKDGNTALKLAILKGRADVVDALLDAGVDPKKEPYNVGKFASGNKAVEAALKKKRK